MVAAANIAAASQEPASAATPASVAPRVVFVRAPNRNRDLSRRVRVQSVEPLPDAAPAKGTSSANAEPDLQNELRGWIKDNASLLSNVSLLVSIAALALGLLPGEGWIEPYVQALILAAALVLLLELHQQWPVDLQLHRLRSASMPANHSWRMSAFSFLMQLATILFVIWAVLTTPQVLFPLTAIAIVFLFRKFYFRRFSGRFAGIIGIVSIIVVLLISEVLALIVWAALTDQTVTIELLQEGRPAINTALEPAD